jgi:GT2 family glycosyltransferase
VTAETPVIVLNWNGWDDTLDCLRSLRAAPDVTAVWLVDNGSVEDQSARAAAIWPGLRVLRLGENLGFAGGMNRALRVAAADGHAFAYLLNNDCLVTPGFLRAARAAAAAGRVGVVGSRVLHAGSGTVLFDGTYHRPGEQADDPRAGDRDVSSVNGAGMLVRLEALQRHGYFDERYFCYHEEVELCRRLARFGWSSVVAGESVVLHKREASDVDGNALYYRTRNRFLLAQQFRGWRRVKRTVLALRTAAVAGRRARRNEDHAAWSVIGTAVHDGLHQRFGQRRGVGTPPLASAQLRMLCALLPVVAPRLTLNTRGSAALGTPLPEGGLPPLAAPDARGDARTSA